MADKKTTIKKDKDLSPELYKVARQKGTEPPFTGKYWNSHEKGIYKCAVCGAELFSSDAKFDSGTGWPSFTSPSKISPSETLEGKPGNDTNIKLREDDSRVMKRTEAVCRNCGVHLGHVFEDGPADKGGKRYCINSVSLELEKEKNEN